jgi:hypothetical protein
MVLEGFAPHGHDRWIVCVTKREDHDLTGRIGHGSKMVRMKMKHQNVNNYFPRCKKRSNAVILGDNFYHVATTNLKFWVTTKVSKRHVSLELSLSQIM